MFAWTAEDVLRVDLKVMSHRLSIYKDTKPVAQKKRKQGEEKREATKKEIDKLMAATSSERPSTLHDLLTL